MASGPRSALPGSWPGRGPESELRGPRSHLEQPPAPTAPRRAPGRGSGSLPFPNQTLLRPLNEAG